ncbi:preprotein translocase subunit SecG [Halarcobacter bivalviorum]|uniref:Protein-export membrane protein SecG n=1 Tax=Halarcobacter bivalviorum TaxID=663364 RepID=A0AAX2A6H1_9BACT|nr:preprotein translocase subunit SecG [Halarcobacter bivalviorum]AXH13535.1 preprotein translocase SecYEG, SecG subunit [Halarcobacter bivalviorum]RXK06691.1 preprotein translocase subunit SecG [Halarcobacter bivalviorum]RXK09859.1 preprotein translocase subunit SecG [Halarcobacter bivalviorum]
MTSTLLIIQFVLAIIITITILLQKSSSIGLGAYSGSNESLFGAKGPGNFLSKATMTLGLLFVINTIALGYIYNQQKMESAVDSVKTETLIPTTPKETTTAPAAPNAAPVVPTIPENK